MKRWIPSQILHLLFGYKNVIILNPLIKIVFFLPNLSDKYPQINAPTNLLFFILIKKTIYIPKKTTEFKIAC
jgi:hypothetical protein